MAKVLILGGGFGGVVAAKRLAEQLGDEHQITLVSRSRHFVFYPALVRLALGKCERDDVSFDLRRSMLDRRVNFIEAEVAQIDPFERRVTIAHGEVEGILKYDYLIFALGRRLASERITGFYEHAHHLLNVDKAIKFGKAIANFYEGSIVIGQCAGSRLPVPVYETAFGLARRLEANGQRDRVKITVVTPGSLGSEFDFEAAAKLEQALISKKIDVLSDFPIEIITANTASTGDGRVINFDLLMLQPPFLGSSAASHVGITNDEGYINVDWTLRVPGIQGMYAVGDSVNFSGPKMGHMAVLQGEVAAMNLASEISGHGPIVHYEHEVKLVLDAAGADSFYFHKDLWTDEPGTVKQGRFWRWAKRVQEKYWEASNLSVLRL